MLSLDVFCNVIDNFGDAGVCLHLARDLSRNGFKVRLYCNDLKVLNTLVTKDDLINPHLKIKDWQEELMASYQPSRTVINAFNCRFDNYTKKTLLDAMDKVLVINLEYLSAENWIEDCHGLVSYADGLQCHYFFPGFTNRTGGLNVDHEFLLQCQQDRPRHPVREISLFSYKNPALPVLLEQISLDVRPSKIKVFEGLALDYLNEAGFGLRIGESKQINNAVLEAVPMVSHSEYDQILLNSDINLVRGEDSIVRAMHTGKVFLWNIYPQDEQSHIVKLKSFLARMDSVLREQDIDTSMMVQIERLMCWYNQAEGTDSKCWPLEIGFGEYEERSANLYRSFAKHLWSRPNLTSQLKDFICEKVGH